MWDTPYGNYRDFDPEPHWSDNFYPSRNALREARYKFDEALKDVLYDIADDNHFDASEWTDEDYELFREIMDL